MQDNGQVFTGDKNTRLILTGVGYNVAEQAQNIPSTSTDCVQTLSLADPSLWPSGQTMIMFSGCKWDCSGGGQRPVALGRCLSQSGINLIYVNRLVAMAEWAGGPLVINTKALDAMLNDLLAMEPGVVLCHLSEYFPYAKLFKDAGWTLIYDVLDDWKAFYKLDEATWYDELIELKLLQTADVLTCSAKQIQDNIKEMSGRDATLILNAVPAMIGDCEQPGDMLFSPDGNVVYCGYLSGNWFDWELLYQTAVDLPNIAFNIVGDAPNPPPYFRDLKNFRFVGEKPYPEAIKYIKHSDVGIIPFRDLSICSSVNPIKYWDHIAACIPTVASWVMTDLRGSPWVFFGARGARSLSKQVKKALAADPIPRKDATKVIKANTWQKRSNDFLSLIKAHDKKKPKKTSVESRNISPSHLDRTNLTEADCNLRVTYTGTSACDMFPPCPYCSTAAVRSEQSGHFGFPRTPEEVSDALLRLGDQYGPMYISLCYGESMASDEAAWVVGQLASRNKVDVVSNIVFPIERLTRFVPANGNVAFCTSFHPHYWGVEDGLDKFLAKRKQIDDAGYHCGICEIVGYPPYLPHIPQWLKMLKDEDIAASVLRFAGMYRGESYPDAYSEDEWQVVEEAMTKFYGEINKPLLRGETPEGLRCWCGVKYVWIDWDGSMHRCSTTRGHNDMGNLFDANLKLLEHPEPCTSYACPCPDLWKFIIREPMVET